MKTPRRSAGLRLQMLDMKSGVTLALLRLRVRLRFGVSAIIATLVVSCTRAPSAPRPPKYPRSHEQQVAEVDPGPAPQELPAADPVDPRRTALLETGELIIGTRSGLEAWWP